MAWTKRFLLALPFAIAAALNVLLLVADRFDLRSEHIAGYGFLFGTPWAWLLDRGWLSHVRTRWVIALEVYSVVLWIPAALYSCCIWLVFGCLKLISRRHSNQPGPD